MKILITVSYNGKNYVGWQTQKKGVSVQSEIEKALQKLFRFNIKIFGSGRTDANVHAIAQTASFYIPDELIKKFLNLNYSNKLILNSCKLVAALNGNLPNDILIIKAKKVKEDFHARYSAKEKIYEYRLQVGRNPFTDNLVGIINKMPNINLITKASKYLIGTHNFKSFCSSKSKVQNYERTINYIKIKKQNRNLIVFTISGNGFLYNMVRIIVGTLVEVGLGKIEPEYVKEILNKKNRSYAGKTFSPCGLYLKKVKY